MSGITFRSRVLLLKFPGFYQSVYEPQFDGVEESVSDLSGSPWAPFVGDFFDNDAYEARVCERVIEWYKEHVYRKFDPDGRAIFFSTQTKHENVGRDLGGKGFVLDRPHEYNQRSDQLYLDVLVDWESLCGMIGERLKDPAVRKAVENGVAKHHTDCDGYWSRFPAKLDEWMAKYRHPDVDKFGYRPEDCLAAANELIHFILFGEDGIVDADERMAMEVVEDVYVDEFFDEAGWRAKAREKAEEMGVQMIEDSVPDNVIGDRFEPNLDEAFANMLANNYDKWRKKAAAEWPDDRRRALALRSGREARQEEFYHKFSALHDRAGEADRMEWEANRETD